MVQVFTAGLVSLKDKKLLLTFSRNKKAYYLPGGKIDSGENPEQALLRELGEELNLKLSVADLIFYTHITAPAYEEPNETMMEQDCFRSDWDGPLLPSSETECIDYFDFVAFKKLKVQVPGVLILMKKLIADGLME
jgi:8-oxo-dGTP pyrophosphatase MutT (NUDIX family)